jgi:hypothetical protein
VKSQYFGDINDYLKCGDAEWLSAMTSERARSRSFPSVRDRPLCRLGRLWQYPKHRDYQGGTHGMAVNDTGGRHESW